LFKSKEKANFLRIDFMIPQKKMALEDIELVENVTNLKSPFEKILICTSIYHKNERKVSFPSYKTV